MADTKVTRNLSELDAQVKNLSRSLKAASTDSAKLDQALKLNPSSVKLAQGRMAAFKNELSLAQQKLEALKKKQKEYDDAIAKGLPVDQQKYQRLKNEIILTESRMEQLTNETKKFNSANLDKIKSGLNGVANVAKVALAGIVALSAAFVSEGDSIDKAAKKLNMDAVEYQRWAYIFDLATGSSDNFTSAMKSIITLSGQVAKESSKAATALALIGLTFDDVKGKSSYEVFQIIMQALAGISDESTRLAAATALLGDSGSYLAQMAGTTTEEIEAMNAAFEENGYLTSQQAAAAAEVADAFTEVKQTYKAVVAQLGTALAPAMKSIAKIIQSLSPVVTALADAFAGLGTSGQLAVIGGLAVVSMLPSLITGIAGLKKGLDLLCTNPVMAAVAGVIAVGTIAAVAGILGSAASRANSAYAQNAATTSSSYVDQSSVEINIETSGTMTAEEVADEVVEALANNKKARGYV